jgi:hypothetical protein
VDERKIQKQTQDVVFEMSDKSEVSGEVFLGLYEAHHTGRQKVGDLLNEQLSFVPVKTARGAILLNMSHIVTVAVRLEVEKDDLMTLGTKYAVRIKTTQGKEVSGDIFVNLPEEISRVKDYFNQPFHFFTIFQPTIIIYINRRFILSIEN